MGYSKEKMTAHGFRGIASTQIRENNKSRFTEATIQSQLSHTVGNKVQQAYDIGVQLKSLHLI